MKPSVNIADIFPKHLFWDMDHSKLHVETDKAVIIPRALYASIPATFEQDIQLLENFYSPEDIVKYLKQTQENISNKICASVSERYHVEPFSRFSFAV